MRAPRIKKEAVETRIRTEEARRVPGTQGDTLKVVQNLPGVARSSFGSGAAHRLGLGAQGDRASTSTASRSRRSTTWAACARRSTPTWCGRSICRRARTAPSTAAASAAWCASSSRRCRKEGVHGYVAADVIDASAMLSRRRRRRACASASPAAQLPRPAAAGWSPRADVGDFVPIPRYDDYQARATLALRQDEELALTFLASDDHLRRTIPSDDPAAGALAEHRQRPSSASSCATRASCPTAPASSSRRRSASTPPRDESLFGSTPITVSAEHLAVRAARQLPAPGRPPRRRSRSALDLQARSVDARPLRLAQPAGARRRHHRVRPAARRRHRRRPLERHWSSTPRPTSTAEIDARPADADPGPALRADADRRRARRCRRRTDATAPLGYSRLDIPRRIPSDRFARLRWAPNPRLVAAFRATKRLTLHRGRRHLRPAARSRGPEPGVRQPELGCRARVHAVGRRRLQAAPDADARDGRLLQAALGSGLAQRAADAAAGAGADPGRIGRSYGGQVLLRQELLQRLLRLDHLLAHPQRAARSPGSATGACSTSTRPTCSACWPATSSATGWDAGARFRYTTGLPRTPVIGAFYDARRRLSTSRSSARTTRSGSRPSTSSTRASRRSFVFRRGEAQRLPRRAERDQPEEPRGDHLQLQLHAGAPTSPACRRWRCSARGWSSDAATSSCSRSRSRRAGARRPGASPTSARRRRWSPARASWRCAATPPEAQPPTCRSPTTRWSSTPTGGSPTPDIAGRCAWSRTRRPRATSSAAPASRSPTTRAATMFTAPRPRRDACTIFGPLAQHAGRRAPADPDVTGGFYQPVRAVWHGATATQTAFGLERILCRIGSNAPTDVAGKYAIGLRPEQQPDALGRRCSTPTAPPRRSSRRARPRRRRRPWSRPGQVVTLQADWADGTAEDFLVYDITSHTLVTQREVAAPLLVRDRRASSSTTHAAAAHDRDRDVHAERLDRAADARARSTSGSCCATAAAASTSRKPRSTSSDRAPGAGRHRRDGEREPRRPPQALRASSRQLWYAASSPRLCAHSDSRS